MMLPKRKVTTVLLKLENRWNWNKGVWIETPKSKKNQCILPLAVDHEYKVLW